MGLRNSTYLGITETVALWMQLSENIFMKCGARQKNAPIGHAIEV